MDRPMGRGFLQGMLLGVAFSVLSGTVALYLLLELQMLSIEMIDIPAMSVAANWVSRNLGLSLVPFGITLALYVYSLRALSQKLARAAPQNEIVQLEHLSDVWTGLFFGIGVIWTAIGMRSALLYAIGNPEEAAQAGAFSILTRLVDGGILTALTTTIVGGVGGYLMRVLKSAYLGNRLSRYYEEREQHHARRVEALLDDIRVAVTTHQHGQVVNGRLLGERQ